MSRPEIEARLRAAFQEQADTVSAKQRPTGRFPTGRSGVVHDLDVHRAMRSRLRRMGPFLLAAAVVVVIAAAGATAASLQSDRPAHPSPSGTAVPSTASVSGPTESPTPPRRSVSGIGGTRAGGVGGPGPGAANSGSPNAPTPTTHSAPGPHLVTLQGVTLTVPGTWQPASGAADRCLTIGGVAYRQAPGGANDNCQVGVLVGSASAADLSAFDPDSPTPLGSTSAVPCGSSDVSTVTAETVGVGGFDATHRVFSAACLGGTYETWVVASDPVVVLYRYDSNGAADEITAALPGANLPGPRSALPVVDHVAVCSVSETALSGQRLFGWLPGGGARDYRSAGSAAQYPLSPATTVTVRTASGSSLLTVADLAQVGAGRTVNGLSPQQLAAAVITISGTGTTVSDVLVDTTTAAPSGSCG